MKFKMKKYIYIFTFISAALLSSCSEDYNENNFPGYKDATQPVNVVNYQYELTAADYNSIANSIKAPIENKITEQNNLIKLKEAELKAATTSADSTRIKAELATLKVTVNDSISKLKLQSEYVIGTTLAKNKCFADSAQFKNGIASVLSSKYIYADSTSSVKVTFKFNVPLDTTAIAATNKYELVATDYTSMGVTSNFSFKAANPSFYLPIFLKLKYPYVAAGTVRLVRYLYDNGTNPVYKAFKVFTYDGTNWTEYNSTVTTSAKFILGSDKVWKYTRSDVFAETFATTLGNFKSYQVSGSKFDWKWASYKGVGYAYANAYKLGAVETWLISPEIILPKNDNLAFSFMHAINYFTVNMDLTDLTAVFISTDFSEDVEAATWEKLDMAYPTVPSWTFVSSGDISLKNYSNKKIHIGFRYKTPADSQEGWEINKFIIKEK